MGAALLVDKTLCLPAGTVAPHVFWGLVLCRPNTLICETEPSDTLYGDAHMVAQFILMA